MQVEARHRFPENANQHYHKAQLKQSGEKSVVEFLTALMTETEVTWEILASPYETFANDTLNDLMMKICYS